MVGLLRQADALLRGSTVRQAAPWQLALLIVACGACYGGVMGTFGGLADDRGWQVVFSAAKVPCLLLTTFCLSLPSFFVLSTLLGVRDDFGTVFRALVSSQAGLTTVLAALAPYTALWYVSFADYQAAVLVNGVLFAVASGTGQLLLLRTYRPLMAQRRQHRWLFGFWLVIYVFVGIQLAWVLRPFVGVPGVPVQFFRQEAWGNAYVVVARLIGQALGSRGP